ncbi:hypothetical protein AB7849_09510 [Rhodanobacter sp. 115]|uniref:hypothetical protein n=1 Tax=Rhodanobacter sp. FW021-MT20 TaxID=1162282 RepID=UPI0034E5EA79
MTANKQDRLQLIRRAAQGEDITTPASAPAAKPFRKRRRWELAPTIPPRYAGRHPALANPMFTTLRSSS